jgi:hypothetical protein
MNSKAGSMFFLSFVLRHFSKHLSSSPGPPWRTIHETSGLLKKFKESKKMPDALLSACPKGPLPSKTATKK